MNSTMRVKNEKWYKKINQKKQGNINMKEESNKKWSEIKAKAGKKNTKIKLSKSM